MHDFVRVFDIAVYAVYGVGALLAVGAVALIYRIFRKR
jgi:hypothetical protein